MFSINDKNDWKIVRKAFSIIDFTEKDLEVWKSKVHPSDGKSLVWEMCLRIEMCLRACAERIGTAPWRCRNLFSNSISLIISISLE